MPGPTVAHIHVCYTRCEFRWETLLAWSKRSGKHLFALDRMASCERGIGVPGLFFFLYFCRLSQHFLLHLPALRLCQIFPQ